MKITLVIVALAAKISEALHLDSDSESPFVEINVTGPEGQLDADEEAQTDQPIVVLDVPEVPVVVPDVPEVLVPVVPEVLVPDVIEDPIVELDEPDSDVELEPDAEVLTEEEMKTAAVNKCNTDLKTTHADQNYDEIALWADGEFRVHVDCLREADALIEQDFTFNLINTPLTGKCMAYEGNCHGDGSFVDDDGYTYTILFSEDEVVKAVETRLSTHWETVYVWTMQGNVEHGPKTAHAGGSIYNMIWDKGT